jgi:N-methylhydantoinase B
MEALNLAVISSRFEGICRKMASTLRRTARSGVINTANDFSCSIVTADHQLLVAAESLPIHVLSGSDLMSQAMQRFHPDLKAGDAFLHNSPYHGCSHPADHTILIPVIDSKGQHQYTVLVKAHQADCGNSVPTTYMGTARDVYHEGALIFPVVQVQRNHEYLQDIIRMCEARIRVPQQWRGDFSAMIGAARVGELALIQMAAELGWDKLRHFTVQWFDYSERCVVELLKTLASGQSSRCAIHDAIPGTPQTGVPVHAAVTVDAAAACITVDLRDNIDALPCGLNLSEATARTAAIQGVLNSIPELPPVNAGTLRRIMVLLREGSVVGIPQHPTSCSVATTNLANRVTNVVQLAMSDIAEDLGMAETGSSFTAAAAVISGQQPQTHQPFINQIFYGHTNGAASPAADGWLTLADVGAAGFCMIDSVEVNEQRFPLRVIAQYIVKDTEGAGCYRGAPGCYFECQAVDTGVTFNYISDGEVNPAQGSRGGGIAAPAAHYKRTLTDAVERLPNAAEVEIVAGESIIAICGGGGGYGPPTQRALQSVAEDVREGYVSVERAATVYGVEIEADSNVHANHRRRQG